MPQPETSPPAPLPQVEIYTDGGCEPNPGVGGYGVVLLHPRKRLETSGGFRLTTNNRMEIMAAVAGLELLQKACRVTLYSDSQYLVDAMMKGWVVKWKQNGWWRTNKDRAVNIDLWERLLGLCDTPGGVSLGEGTRWPCRERTLRCPRHGSTPPAGPPRR